MAEGHILLAVSQPWAAEHAVRAVARLAGRLDSSIVVLHVARRGEVEPARFESTLSAIEEFVKRIGDDGVQCEVRFASGVEDVVGEILKVADELAARLILIGIPGKSTFARATNGDVPAQLMRRTTRPLMLLPPTTDVDF